MTASDSGPAASPMVGTAGWIDALAFTPRKESWVASSAGSFYKIFRKSDDPAQDWLDPACVKQAGREYADMLFLCQFSDRICSPIRLDHACIVYPQLSGPDMRAMLQWRGTTDAQRTAGLRDAVVLLSRLHMVNVDASRYPVKDYLSGLLPPSRDVIMRIAGRERTIFISGFEVRNFRFDRPRGGWFFFDPQHMFLGMPEDDLARFVISLLMVNWGKGGSLRLWQDFDIDDLLSTYEQTSTRLLDKTLLNYFLRETIAMRRRFAEKALRAMNGARRILGQPYLAAYFLQLEKWAANHEF